MILLALDEFTAESYKHDYTKIKCISQDNEHILNELKVKMVSATISSGFLCF